MASHRRDDAEFCVAAQHTRATLRRVFERIGFNHWTHAGQFGEVQSVSESAAFPVDQP